MSQRPPVDQSPAHWCVLYYANVPPPSVPPWIIHPLVRGELAWGTLTRRHFLSQDANNHSLYFLFLPGMQDSFAAYNKSLLLKWPKRWYQDWSWVIVTSSLPLSLEVSSTMPLALQCPSFLFSVGLLHHLLHHASPKGGLEKAVLVYHVSQLRSFELSGTKWMDFLTQQRFMLSMSFMKWPTAKENFVTVVEEISQRKRVIISPLDDFKCLGSLPIANWTLSKVQNNPSKRHVWCFMGPLRNFLKSYHTIP